MNLKRVVLHNFMSYKDVDIILDKEVVYNILGKNGSGKSSIRDAITYCLFGKGRYDDQEAYIKDNENDMFVMVEFSQNNRTFKVTRQKERKQTTKLEVEEIK